MIWMPISW